VENQVLVLTEHHGEECGQGLVEYALILVLISLDSIGIVTTVGGQVANLFTSVSAALTP
jgi:pilus assembly protein Flp/PilA